MASTEEQSNVNDVMVAPASGETQQLLKNQSQKSIEESDEENKMFWQKISIYQVYTLIIFLITYLLNQLDRYMLAITIKPMSQELKFGDMDCMLLSNYSSNDAISNGAKCEDAKDTKSCFAKTYGNGSEAINPCKWDYNGQGFEYQIVAGPVFIVIYTFAGIFISFAADKYNRKVMLGACLILWSVMTLLTGFIKEYWQLVLLRFGLGFGEAGCTPFVASMLTDIYPTELRGTALGIYNWGIYMGYSLSYALGNLITAANINGQGWRWSFFISGIPGILMGLLIFVTVKEPERKNASMQSEQKDTQSEQPKASICQRLGTILKPFLAPSLMLAILAGSVRNAAGYVFAYNTQPYFTGIGQTKEDIAKYMGWIPIVGGSLGVAVGGFISDRVVKGRGIYARVVVVIFSLLVAAPFAAGTLFLSPPWAYICQIPTYLFGEMWIGITLAIVVEMIPSNIRTSAVAVYLFIISNIGGNMPLLVPPIQQAFENGGYTKSQSLRGALYILYPGLYVAGAVLFIPAMFLLKRDQKRMQFMEYVNMQDSSKALGKMPGEANPAYQDSEKPPTN
ncbi:protein spinster homolog 1-like [Mya arenaria]|uniref:protein spinster homolog 1-like n=1 Tax=Mya arenaria TaxID=6604 RepID=UPI0022E461E4|nr:protein spinster homolog 1-like [Mya arenaria]